MTKVLRRLEGGMLALLMTGESAEYVYGDLNGVLPDDQLLVLTNFDEEDGSLYDEPVHIFNLTAASVTVEQADELLDGLLSDIAEMERQAIQELRDMVQRFLKENETNMDQ